MKVEALCWLRFERHLPYVCTEVGPWNADVLGMNNRFSVEVEVKTSKADLRREFSTKKSKHFLYNNADGGTPPNYFYFMVPKDIAEYAVELVKSMAPKAGVAVYDPDNLGFHRHGSMTYVAKPPVRLHKEWPTDALKHTVLNRMSSELCARYVVHRKYMEQVLDQLKALDAQLVNTVNDLAKKTEEAHEPEAGAQDGDREQPSPVQGPPHG